VRSIFKVVSTVFPRVGDFEFGHLNVFRISIFDFRICPTYFCDEPYYSLSLRQYFKTNQRHVIAKGFLALPGFGLLNHPLQTFF